MSSPHLLSLAFAAATLAIGCAPAIGDECETALDCSSQGSRICDRTQPSGYCTIEGCEEGTCPEDSVCVKFRPSIERVAVSYCMAGCDNTSDCRNDEGYRCRTAQEFGADGLMEAEILGDQSAQFCTIPRPLMSVPEGPEPDAGMSVDPGEDAGS
jgi:hypothetical protein